MRTQKNGRTAGLRAATAWPTLLAVAVTVSPWLIRNQLVFGRPILATTHGGYTLLLGNNPIFYREVVDQPWGTVWDEVSLSDWNRTLEDAMEAAEPRVEGELARNDWMYRRAWANIRSEPGRFAAACWLRFRRFWNLAPLGPVRESMPSAVLWGIISFYGLVTAGLILGLLRLRAVDWRRWMPLLLLLLSFCAVHLLFWSNARMRAALVPVIAVLTARGVSGLSGRRRPVTNTSRKP